jgi:protein tyrosine phosphatase (PTP) superfamily phosphohydrolase (DUF442 family)
VIEDIFKYLRIDDRIATGGQPTARQFNEISAAGFKFVINLALPNSVHAIPDEGELVSACGMTYVHIPVNFETPARSDYETFCGVMKSFAGRKVFVHCAMNMRASAFVFLHRVQHEGIDEETALADLHQLWKPDEVWQRFIDTVLADTK